LEERRDRGERSFVSFRCLPYEYIKSFSDLYVEHFPSKDEFFSSLKSCDIEEDVYSNTKMIYKEFSCKNLLDLLKIYQLRYTFATSYSFW